MIKEISSERSYHIIGEDNKFYSIPLFYNLYYAGLGDSIIKKKGHTDILLIRNDTKERMILHFTYDGEEIVDTAYVNDSIY